MLYIKYNILKYNMYFCLIKVWLPRGSRMFEEDLWVKANFPERIRYEAVIIEDENVLSPQTLNAVSN
jgi:hypothetical protein